MFSRTMRIVTAVSLAGAAAIGATAAAYASPAQTPHMVPASTRITANLKAGTVFKATGDIDGVAITVKCTKVTAKGKTPADGLTANLKNPPTFSGCKDTLGGTDTVTTAGAWSITLNSTGSAGTLNTPQNAATFSSSILPSCVVTVNPSGPTAVAFSYNNVNTAKIKNQNLPASGSGCTTSPNTSVSSTLVVVPGVSVQG